jgi:hypothetical protein
MPINPARLIDELIEIMMVPRRAAPPGRTQMRPAAAPAPAAGVQVDMEALARQLSSRTAPASAPSPGPTPATASTRPATAAGPVPAATPGAPIDMQALARTMAARVQEVNASVAPPAAAPTSAPAAPGVQPTPVTAAPRVSREAIEATGRGTSESAAQLGARSFLIDHLGYIPASLDPLAWARKLGLTSPETYRPGTAQPHPTLYRGVSVGAAPTPPVSAATTPRGPAPGTTPRPTRYPEDILNQVFRRSQPGGITESAWLTTPQRRAMHAAGLRPTTDPVEIHRVLNEAGLPITAGQISRRLTAVRQMGGTTGTPLTPSRVGQSQSQRVAPPADPWVDPDVARWVRQRGLGKSGQEFGRRYFAGLMERPQIYTTSGGGTLHMSGDLRVPPSGWTLRRQDGSQVQIPGGTTLGNMTRTINARDRYAYNNYFELDDRFHRLSIAKTLLKAQVALYRRMGLDKVTVSAGLSGGGHSWARFGFIPDANGWQTLRGAILARLDRLEATGLGPLDPAYEADVRQLLRNDDPVTLRRVARLGMTPGANADSGSGLGQYLLRGLGWRGTLDLRDAATMRHFDEYVRDAPAPPGAAP